MAFIFVPLCVAAYLGNPLFLVKTRMQAYSPVLPVGAQRYYQHGWDALSTIVREEGAKGLLRGWDAAILRGAIGGSVCIVIFCVKCSNDSGGSGATTELHLEQDSAGAARVRSGQHMDVFSEQLDRGRDFGRLFLRPSVPFS